MCCVCEAGAPSSLHGSSSREDLGCVGVYDVSVTVSLATAAAAWHSTPANATAVAAAAAVQSTYINTAVVGSVAVALCCFHREYVVLLGL